MSPFFCLLLWFTVLWLSFLFHYNSFQVCVVGDGQTELTIECDQLSNVEDLIIQAKAKCQTILTSPVEHIKALKDGHYLKLSCKLSDLTDEDVIYLFNGKSYRLYDMS